MCGTLSLTYLISSLLLALSAPRHPLLPPPSPSFPLLPPPSPSSSSVMAAYAHVLGDLAQSVAVAIAGALIWWQSDVNGNHLWQIADPICTFVFSILVLVTTVNVVKNSMSVMMEGVPAGIDPKKLEEELKTVGNVSKTHDLHIWALTVGQVRARACVCVCVCVCVCERQLL